jgi:16S rRNA (cytosine967-C5)-methyltransferase
MAPRSQTGGGSESVDRRSPPAAHGGGPAPARRCAYAVIRRVFEQGAYADRALQGEARELDSRDRALAMRLAYGAIQRRGTIDHMIERLAGRPLARLDAPVAAALRLGLYELLYLSGAPDRAVVADAVELAKHGPGAGHGLVNAVLRRAARDGAQALLDDLRDDTPESAAIAHSHPEWIARMWWEELGAEQARALMAAGNEPGEVALRVNTLRTEPATDAEAGDGAAGAAVASELGVSTHGDPEIPEALVLDGPFDLHRSPQWRAGAILAQSRAAMLVSRVLDPQPGERILDLCAAPGGKTTHLAALMQNQGEVVAVERNAKRASQLRDTGRRLGADIVRVEVSDAALPRAEGAVYDRVLVDPPCSGLGTLAAHPDLRWRVTPEHLAEMVDAQAAILAAGALALRPGGTLVYATCTICAAENQRQIERLLDAHPDFALDDLTTEFAAYADPTAPGALLTLPHRDRTAGFFIARLRRGS